jgi:hypothetical protein
MRVTIDERLEALTQTVEIIAGMQRDNERRFAETDRRMAQVLEAITQLGRIAESHDHGLDNLEDRPH